MKFVIFKKRWIFVLFAILVASSAVFAVCKTVNASSPKAEYVVVIDAGHGGVDGGAEGKTTGISESYLNLQYALTLQKICEGFGWEVVMTRSDMNGLYSSFASNKKRSEMEKRKKIIQNSGADMVVSIHMNSFPISDVCGAQVYYFIDADERGQALAQSVQDSLFSSMENAKKTAKAGDFFVLNCTDSPSIMVECGFLSNAQEELLLQDEEYMQTFCYTIFCGMLKYLQF